jgi:AraC-like DNA-binding protein
MKHFVLLSILFLFTTSLGDAPDSSKTQPIISSDSAIIISPKHRSVLNQKTVTYTVNSKCAITGMDLLVSYYPSMTDTLARLSKPPFSTVWNYAHIPDQDQIHLQFGYILYHVNGDTIVSAPTPHHWIIDRKIKKSKKRYACKQTLEEEDITIDGTLNEWESYRRNELSSTGSFRCAWTPISFFIAVEVYDPTVTIHDRIEVCFDMTRSRSQFLGKDQRIVSFCPKTISFCWAVDVSNTGATVLDSVLARMDEEMDWRNVITDYSYIIEARIPLYLLSNLQFPNKQFGFDVAVIDINDSREFKPNVFCWSGAEPSDRHSPAGWGTIVLTQPFLPLKVLFIISLSVIFILLIGIAVLSFVRGQKDRQYEKIEQKEPSPQLKKIFEIIDNNINKPALNLIDLAQMSGLTIPEIEKVLKKELNTSCNTIITFSRIKKAKDLLVNSDRGVKNIAQAVGYTDSKAFIKSFKTLAGVTPEEWRRNRAEDDIDEDDIDEID